MDIIKKTESLFQELYFPQFLAVNKKELHELKKTKHSLGGFFGITEIITFEDGQEKLLDDIIEEWIQKWYSYLENFCVVEGMTIKEQYLESGDHWERAQYEHIKLSGKLKIRHDFSLALRQGDWGKKDMFLV